MNQLNFFNEGSPFLKHPALTAERTVSDVDFVASELGLAAGARLLDVGCGFGRHSVELARRGFEVVGIDPAAAMIAAARQRAAAAAVSVDFRQARAETFTADREFDAAICLFNTLGQVSESGENSGLVGRVYAALQPGGRFVVESPQRETAVRQLKPSDRFGGKERYADVARQFNPQDNTVTEVFNVVTPQTTTTYRLRYRLYDREELTALLTGAGFAIQSLYGGYDRSPLQSDSPVMLAIARRRMKGEG